MLHFVRLFGLLLALSFLTGSGAAGFGCRGDAAVQPYTSVAQAPAITLQVRLAYNHSRVVTAELEDGPEGEGTPIATFVRSYDGDDQFQAAFGPAELSDGHLTRHAVRPWPCCKRTHPAIAGFPTGPPVS